MEKMLLNKEQNKLIPIQSARMCLKRGSYNFKNIIDKHTIWS